MINEKRVKLMTKMAVFEVKNDSELYKVQTYFRSDYIGSHLIKNGFRITVVFLLGLIAWGCYNMEKLVNEITTMDIGALVFRILFAYLIVLCIFLVITYALFAVRYAKAKEGYDYYQTMVRKLEREYEKEESVKARKMGTGGNNNGKPD